MVNSFFIRIIFIKHIIKILNRLLPKISPRANFGFFRIIDERHVISSGSEVTPANRIPPITAFDMLLVLLRLSAYIDIFMLKKTVKKANIKKNISFTCITY